MAEIVQAIPLPLSQEAAGAATWTNTSVAFQIAIGGMPFLLANSDDFPLQRSTVQAQKDQLDTSDEPGEHSFSGWWTRSQISFHSGAGVKYLEPGSDEVIMSQFFESEGVDPWTSGQVTLLPQVDNVYSGASEGAVALGYVDDAGADGFLYSSNSSVFRHDGSAGVSATWGGAGAVVSMVHDGTSAYIADDAVGIYSMPLSSGAGALLWNTSGAATVLGWQKQRLMAGIGRGVYELADISPAPSLPNAIYTHPSADWEWKDFTSGPTAVYAAGFAGGQGAIFAFKVDESGDVPVLNSAVVAADLPTGEVPYSIYGYLGAYIGIGTNRGLRVGVISTDGSIQYGPLIFETAHPVRSMVGKDRFLYVGVEAEVGSVSGVVRVDLSAEIEPLRYAYATDLQTDSLNEVSSVSILGTSGRIVMASRSAFLESTDTLVESGFLTTGKVRFGTFEDKLFKAFRARVDAAAGTLGVSAIAANGAETPLITLDSSLDLRSDIAIRAPTGPQEYLALKFQLNRDASDVGAGPTFYGYQLKALPSADFGEVLKVPVLLFDRERDPNGLAFGYAESAWARFQALKDLERTGDTRRYQDLRVGAQARVTVESVAMQEVTPSWGRSSGFGGVCYITMRTVP